MASERFLPQEVIRRKRDGKSLVDEEIQDLVTAITEEVAPEAAQALVRLWVALHEGKAAERDRLSGPRLPLRIDASQLPLAHLADFLELCQFLIIELTPFSLEAYLRQQDLDGNYGHLLEEPLLRGDRLGGRFEGGYLEVASRVYAEAAGKELRWALGQNANPAFSPVFCPVALKTVQLTHSLFPAGAFGVSLPRHHPNRIRESRDLR